MPLCYTRQELVEPHRSDVDPQSNALLVCIGAVTFAVVFALTYGGWSL